METIGRMLLLQVRLLSVSLRGRPLGRPSCAAVNSSRGTCSNLNGVDRLTLSRGVRYVKGLGAMGAVYC